MPDKDGFLTPKELSKSDLPTIGRELMRHYENNKRIVAEQQGKTKEMKQDGGFYGHMTVPKAISKSGGRVKTC